MGRCSTATSSESRPGCRRVIQVYEGLVSMDFSPEREQVVDGYPCHAYEPMDALPPWQVQMVEAARACGASAKFAGSGGAIVGLYRDDGMFETVFETVRARLAEVGSRTIRPRVVECRWTRWECSREQDGQYEQAGLDRV